MLYFFIALCQLNFWINSVDAWTVIGSWCKVWIGISPSSSVDLESKVIVWKFIHVNGKAELSCPVLDLLLFILFFLLSEHFGIFFSFLFLLNFQTSPLIQTKSSFKCFFFKKQAPLLVNFQVVQHFPCLYIFVSSHV